jgi:hypothetical protein
MAFDIELAPEGVVDRLDQLPQRLEQVCSRPLGLALAGWPQQRTLSSAKTPGTAALRDPPTASALERLGSVVPGLAAGDLEAGADLGVAVDADDLLAAGAGPALEAVG